MTPPVLGGGATTTVLGMLRVAALGAGGVKTTLERPCPAALRSEFGASRRVATEGTCRGSLTVGVRKPVRGRLARDRRVPDSEAQRPGSCGANRKYLTPASTAQAPPVRRFRVQWRMPRSQEYYLPMVHPKPNLRTT